MHFWKKMLWSSVKSPTKSIWVFNQFNWSRYHAMKLIWNRKFSMFPTFKFVFLKIRFLKCHILTMVQSSERVLVSLKRKFPPLCSTQYRPIETFYLRWSQIWIFSPSFSDRELKIKMIIFQPIIFACVCTRLIKNFYPDSC